MRIQLCKIVPLVLALLIAWRLPGQQKATAPVLRLNLPQAEATIQSISPSVHIVPTYGGNAGLFYWEVTMPVLLAGSEGACSFNLDLSTVRTGAATLTGRHNDVVGKVQVDSFGGMSAAQALAAAYQFAAKLQSHGWTSNPYIQPSPIKAKHLLQRDFGVAISDLRCGHSQILISADSDPRHPKSAIWSFTYGLPSQPDLLSTPSVAH
jgi:hypothetical protein